MNRCECDRGIGHLQQPLERNGIAKCMLAFVLFSLWAPKE